MAKQPPAGGKSEPKRAIIARARIKPFLREGLKEEVEMEKVYIRIQLFLPLEREDIVWVHLIELSPPTFNGRVKYGIEGYKEQHSFEELQRDLMIEEGKGQIHKYFIKRGGKLGLFVVNAETGQKQIFRLDFSKYWPMHLKAGNSRFIRTKYIEITPHLEKIGVL